MPEWLKVALAVLGTLAIPTTIVTAVGWLVQSATARQAQRRQSELTTELELTKAKLQELQAQRQDTLTRKREVYARLITGMRVMIQSDLPATDEEKKAFLRAYDESCLWASEEVATAIRILLILMRDEKNAPQEAQKAVYNNCVIAMRKECLGDDSCKNFEYQFVKFGPSLQKPSKN